MKNNFLIKLIFITSILFSSENITFSIGSSNQRTNDINVKFEESGLGSIELKIDQISSKMSDFNLKIQNPNYIDYLKWLTKLSNAEMRGLSFNVKLLEENIDIKLDVDRTLVEMKDIDMSFNAKNDDFQINSFNFKYILSNLEFFAPYINNDVDEELKIVKRLIPDGRISKMDINASYSKIDNILNIAGSLRMLSGSGLFNIEIIINENSVDLTYVKNFSLKLNNLAEGFFEYIDKIEESTSFSVKRLGRGSFELSYSCPIKEFGSKQNVELSYASVARSTISNIHNASKMYYQTKGEWPGDVEQLERAGELDLDRSIKLKWVFDLNLPEKIYAISTSEMKGGSNKTVIFDALRGGFYGYGSEEDSDASNFSNDIVKKNNSTVCIETDYGLIEIALLPDIAPKHVESFLIHVNNGYYNGTTFHRIIPGFMIQGGDPLTRKSDRSKHGTGGHAGKYFGIGQEYNSSTWDIPAEFSPIPHERGIVSIARSKNPNSAGSQFFIIVSESKFLDNQYTVFGKVLSGMNVVDDIVSQPRDDKDNPKQNIEMNIYICN